MLVTKGWKYKNESLEIQPVSELAFVMAVLPFVSLRNGFITIKEQYAWNGASFFLFTWFGTPDSWLIPSLIHDALYQLMREGKLDAKHRQVVDAIFYRLLRERGVWYLIACLAHYAVRIGGNYAMRHGPKAWEVK